MQFWRRPQHHKRRAYALVHLVEFCIYELDHIISDVATISPSRTSVSTPPLGMFKYIER
jgi:hypothetical protein